MIPVAWFLVMVSICALYVSELHDWQVEHYYDHLEASSHEHLTILSLAFEAPFTSVETVALNPLFRAFEESEDLIVREMRSLEMESAFLEVGFVDMSGNMLNDQGEWETFLYADTSRLLSKTSRFVQRVSLDGNQYDEQFLLSVPVYDRGTQLGSLVAIYDIEYFSSLFLVEQNYIQESTTFCVLNTNGDIVMNDPSGVYMNINADFFEIPDDLTEEQTELLLYRTKLLEAGKTISFSYEYAGREYLVQVLPINLENFDTNTWYLAELVDAELISENISSINRFAYIMVAISLLISIIVCFVIYKFKHLQEEYRIIAQGLRGGVRRGVLSKKAGVDYISPGLATLFGYSYKEMVKKTREHYKDLIYYQDSHIYEEAINYLSSNFGTRHIEYRIHHRSGELMWVSDRITAVRMVNSKIYIYAVVTDINDSKNSKHNLNTLMDSIPGGIVIFDIAYQSAHISVPFINDEMCDMVGFSMAELRERISENVWNVAVPEDRELIQEKFQNVIQGSDFEECTYRTYTKTGTMWLRLTARVIQRDIEHIQIYAVIMNIDEQMRTEAILKKERYYQDLIDESLDAATLITAFDENRTLLHVSKNIYNLLGYREDEFKKIYHDKYKDLVHPMELKRIVNLKKLYAEREVINYELQFRARHKNGDYIWLVEKATLIEDVEGKQAHLIVAFDDSGRKKAEEELQVREEEFRIASLQNNKIVYRYDLTLQKITVPNGVEDRIGFTQHQEHIPNSILDADLIHPDSKERVREFFQDIKSNKEKGEIECVTLPIEGDECKYLMRYTLVHNADRQAVSAIISAINITDRK